MVKKREVKNDFFVVALLRNQKDGIIINWAEEGYEQSRPGGGGGVRMRFGLEHVTDIKLNEAQEGDVGWRCNSGNYWHVGNT